MFTGRAPHCRPTILRPTLLALLFSIGVSTPLWAQSELADAVSAAFERYPESQLGTARTEVGKALQARAADPLAAPPTVNLKYQTDALNNDQGYREWEGGIELPLRLPGQRSAQQLEAQRTLASADLLVAAKKLDVAGEVRERYWRYALAHGRERQAQLAFDSAKALENDIQRRLAAGELPRADLLLAQQEVLDREDTLRQAGSEALQAKQRFLVFTGLTQVPAVAAEQPGATEMIDDTHPQLALASAEAATASAHRNRVASERNSGPSVWIGGKSTRDQAGLAYDNSLGVEVSIPFGGKAHTAPAVAEANQALSNAQVARDMTKRTLDDALLTARLDYDSAQAALLQAKRSQTLADESLRLSERAFALGETDLVRLLRARGLALNARQQFEIRGLEVGRAAARINQALGVIPQ